jgi:hypothetical protein
LIKDNIYELESGIKERVRLYYEKDLADTRHQLAELKLNFENYRENMSASLKEQIHDQISAIEMRLKEKLMKDDLNKLFENQEAFLRDKYRQLLSKAEIGKDGDKV